MTAKEQNRLAGIFLMAHGALQAVFMLLFGAIYGLIGASILLGGRPDEAPVGFIFIGIIAVMLVVTVIFALPQFIGGWKMFKERPNARNWGIAASILSCMSFPLGTAAGVYGLVFLFGDEGKRYYFGGYAPNLIDNPPNPPEPSSWK